MQPMVPQSAGDGGPVVLIDENRGISFAVAPRRLPC